MVVGSLLKHLSTNTKRHEVHDERHSQNFDNRLIRQEHLQATTVHDLRSQAVPGQKQKTRTDKRTRRFVATSQH